MTLERITGITSSTSSPCLIEENRGREAPPLQIACNPLRQNLWARGIIDETGKLLIDLPLPKLTQTEQLIDQLGVRLFKLIEEFWTAVDVSRIELLGGYVLHYLANYAPDYLREAFAKIPEIADRLIESGKGAPNDIDIRFYVKGVRSKGELEALKEAFLELLGNSKLETSLIFTGISNFALVREPPYEYLIVDTLQLDYLFNSVYIPLESPKAPLQLMSYAEAPLQGWLDQALGFCRTEVFSSQFLFRIVSEMTKGRIPIEEGTIAKARSFKADYLKEAEKTLAHHPTSPFVYYLNLSLILDQRIFPEEIQGLEPWMEFAISDTLPLSDLARFIALFFLLTSEEQPKLDHLEGKTPILQFTSEGSVLNLPCQGLQLALPEKWVGDLMHASFIPHLCSLSKDPIKTIIAIARATKTDYLKALTTQLMSELSQNLHQGKTESTRLSSCLLAFVKQTDQFETKKKLLELGNEMKWIFNGTEKDVQGWLEVLTHRDAPLDLDLYTKLRENHHFIDETRHAQLAEYLLTLKNHVNIVELDDELKWLQVESLDQEAKPCRIAKLIICQQTKEAYELILGLPALDRISYLKELVLSDPTESNLPLQQLIEDACQTPESIKDPLWDLILSKTIPHHLIAPLLDALPTSKILSFLNQRRQLTLETKSIESAFKRCDFSDLPFALKILTRFGASKTVWARLLSEALDKSDLPVTLECIKRVDEPTLLYKALIFLTEMKFHKEAFALADRIYHKDPDLKDQLWDLCKRGIEDLKTYIPYIQWFAESKLFSASACESIIRSITFSLLKEERFPDQVMDLIERWEDVFEQQADELWLTCIEKAPLNCLSKIAAKQGNLSEAGRVKLWDTLLERASDTPFLLNTVATCQEVPSRVKEQALFYCAGKTQKGRMPDKAIASITEPSFLETLSERKFSKAELENLPHVIIFLIEKKTSSLLTLIQLGVKAPHLPHKELLDYLMGNRKKLRGEHHPPLFFLLRRILKERVKDEKILTSVANLSLVLPAKDCLCISFKPIISEELRNEIVRAKLDYVSRSGKKESEILAFSTLLPGKEVDQEVKGSIFKALKEWIRANTGCSLEPLRNSLYKNEFSRVAGHIACNLLIENKTCELEDPYFKFLHALYLDENFWSHDVQVDQLYSLSALLEVMLEKEGCNTFAYFSQVCSKIPSEQWLIIKEKKNPPTFFAYQLNQDDPQFLIRLLSYCVSICKNSPKPAVPFRQIMEYLLLQNRFLMNSLRDHEKLIYSLYKSVLETASLSPELLLETSFTFFTHIIAFTSEQKLMGVRSALLLMPEEERNFKFSLRKEFFHMNLQRLETQSFSNADLVCCHTILMTTIYHGWYSRDPLALLTEVENYLPYAILYINYSKVYLPSMDLFVASLEFTKADLETPSVKEKIEQLLRSYISNLKGLEKPSQAALESLDTCCALAESIGIEVT